MVDVLTFGSPNELGRSLALPWKPLLPCDFEGEAFEVFGFGDRGEDGVVGGLGVGFDFAEDTVGVEGSFEDDLLERVCVDVMGAAERGEDAISLEKLEGAEVNLLVAAEGVGDRGAVASEGRWIQDDQIVARDDFFVGASGGLGFEPVEDVGGFEGALPGEAIYFGVFCGRGESFGALVETVDLGSAGFGCVQGETAQEAEGVEDVCAFSIASDGLVVDLLVEVIAGFMAAEEVDREFHSVQIDGDRAFEGAVNDAVDFGEPFEFAGADIVSFDDGAGLKHRLEHVNDVGLAGLHAEGGKLEGKDILVFVDDEAAEEVAFGVYDTEGSGVRQGAFAEVEGFADALFEIGAIDFDPVGVDEPDVDLGFTVVEANAEEAMAMILHLDGGAVCGSAGEAQDGAGIDPGMAGQDAICFAGAKHHSG